jgi:hypothetical protein
VTVVEQIVRLVCCHEAGHAVVARALGCTVEAVDVFNVGGHCAGKASVCSFVTGGGPRVGAIVAAAGEQAELALCPELVGVDYQHVQMYRALSGQVPVPPGHFTPPPRMSDARTIVGSAVLLRRPDVLAFTAEVATVAAARVRNNRDAIDRLAADLYARCERAGILSRCPPGGVDGDGPQWIAVLPGAPGPLVTLAAVVSEMVRVSAARTGRFN